MRRTAFVALAVLVLAGVPLAAAAMLYVSRHDGARETYVIEAGRLQPARP